MMSKSWLMLRKLIKSPGPGLMCETEPRWEEQVEADVNYDSNG
jgi:hypothetical protein